MYNFLLFCTLCFVYVLVLCNVCFVYVLVVVAMCLTHSPNAGSIINNQSINQSIYI